jgi:ribosomal protein S18 acetylase RimI-like enzyme
LKVEPGYHLIEAVVSAADCCRLREIAGMSPRSEEAARIGLPNSFHGVHITFNGDVVGMGRIIGDGACCFQLCDIAVDPAHQGRGLGKRIVCALMAYLRLHAPAGAYVSLIADGDACFLYAQFGFKPTAPDSIGMSLNLSP